MLLKCIRTAAVLLVLFLPQVLLIGDFLFGRDYAKKHFNQSDSSLEGLNETEDWDQHDLPGFTVLLRKKRQIGGLSCPTRPATGSDGGRSKLIFYSPQARQDIRIAYGSKGWNKDDLEMLMENGFNLEQATLIYLHAYTQSARTSWLNSVRRQYDREFPEETGYNLLFFDWSSFSRQLYGTSVSWAPHLGEVLSNFLKDLSKVYSYNMTNMHLISYSLSTHIAGLAGRKMKALGEAVGRITALDPTGVCFHQDTSFAKKYSLQPTDANLVVARHYDMGGLGARRAIGGLDVFVNNGKNQPFEAANSRRSTQISRDEDEMFVSGPRALNSHGRAAEHEVGFENQECNEIAYACSSYAAYLAGECADCGSNGSKCYYTNTLGTLRLDQEPAKYPLGTKMYLKTATTSPFCLHLYQLVVELKSSASSKSKSLLKQGLVSLKLGSPPIGVSPSHRQTNQRYTVLLIRNRKTRSLSSYEPIIKIDSTENETREFLNSLKHVELNYMSNALASERAKSSSKFCWSFDENKLIGC